MDPARYDRIKALFLAVRSLRPGEREQALAEACGDDARLRDEVRALCETPSGSFGLDLPDNFAGGATPTASADPAGGPSAGSLPERIGPYRILGLLGEGGMGVVYRAEQSEPLRREVALKVMRRGKESMEALARFEAERQALVRMDHPNIARVLDAGSDEQGRPFVAMELVRGPSITEYARAHGLSVRQRIELFRAVCRAVHDAHVKGIVHRDLKPSNILVTTQDGVPMPRIIDFGIAKFAGTEAGDPEGATGLTLDGRLIGTLDYMSPEQARGMAGAVDTRADVYSLGVVLYELVSGSLPYTLRERPLAEALDVIRHREPPVLRIAGNRGGVDGSDLNVIVQKALAKSPVHRYDSAAALADDLDRCLRSEPILARPPTTLYQLGRLAVRHKVAAGFLAASFAFAVILAIVMSVQAAAQRRERRRAETEAATSAEVTRFLAEMLASASSGDRNVDVRVREILDDAARRIDVSFEGNPTVESAIRRTIGTSYTALGRYDEARRQLTAAGNLRTSALGPAHPLVGEIWHDLAALELAEGGSGESLARADSLCRAALALRLSALGPDHQDVATSLEQLAGILDMQGQLGAADSLYRRSIAIREQERPANPAQLAGTLVGYSQVLVGLNRVAEAESTLRAGLALTQGTYPEGHPAVTDAQSTLGHFLYHQRGNMAAGDSMLRRSLASERRVWGPAHPRVADALATLGGLEVQRGHYVEAESLYLEAFEIKETVHGPDSPRAAEAHNDLGHFYWSIGRPADAVRHFRIGLELWERQGNDGWQYAMGLNNMGQALADAGENREARQVMLQSLDRMEAIWGPDHAHVALLNNNIGVNYLMRGWYREAEPFVRRALAIWTRTENRDYLTAATGNLGYLLHAMDRLPEAEIEFRRCLEFFPTSDGPKSWTAMQANHAVNLAVCLYHLGRPAEAEAAFRTAREWYRNHQAENQATHAYLLANLGSVLVEEGRLPEGEELLRRAIRELDPNRHGVWIPWTRNALAECLYRSGRRPEADSLFTEAGASAWSADGLLPPATRIARERYRHRDSQ